MERGSLRIFFFYKMYAWLSFQRAFLLFQTAEMWCNCSDTIRFFAVCTRCSRIPSGWIAFTQLISFHCMVGNGRTPQSFTPIFTCTCWNFDFKELVAIFFLVIVGHWEQLNSGNSKSFSPLGEVVCEGDHVFLPSWCLCASAPKNSTIFCRHWYQNSKTTTPQTKHAERTILPSSS